MPTFQAELADGRVIEFEAERQPTEEELSHAIAQQASQQAPEIGAGKTFLEHAAVGIGPGAAFIAASGPGAALGAEIGAPLGPLGMAAGGAIGGLVTGVPAAWGAHKLQSKALHAIAPEFAQKLDTELAAGEQQHPLAAIGGDIASFGPSAKLAPFKLAQLPFRAALGAGIGAGLPLLQGQKPTGRDIAVGAGSGILFGEGRFKLLPKATAAARQSLQEGLRRETGVKSSPESSGLQDPGKATQQQAEYLAAERAAIDAGEAEGSPVEVVDKFSDETADRQFMRPTPKGVEVNRSEFRKWLESVPEAQRADAIQQRVAEEHIHRHVPPDDALTYWNSLSRLEQMAESRAYFGEGVWSLESAAKKLGVKFSETQLGHEAIRRRMQRLASGTSSEIAEAALKERWKLEGLDALSRTIKSIRETLGTDASKQGLDILARIEGNLDAARVAIGGQEGQEPAAFRKESDRHYDEKIGDYIRDLEEQAALLRSTGNTAEAERYEAHAEATKANNPRWQEQSFPAALRRRGPSDEPELPIGPTAGKGQLSKPATGTATDLRIPPRVVTPALVTAEAQRHFSEASRPSFDTFKSDVRTKLGDVQPGQLQEAFEDAMWKGLTTATGSELGAMRSKLGLGRELGLRDVADAAIEETGQFRLEGERNRTTRELDEAGRKRVVAEQNYRNEVIGRIAEKLTAEMQTGRKAWNRREVSPEEVRLGTETKEAALRPIGSQELSNPEALGRTLTADAGMERSTVRRKVAGGRVVEARMKAPPETVTKRLTAFVNKTNGRVELVSTYPHSRAGAMVVDPVRLGKARPNVPLASALGRFTPIYSVLLDEPVQNFHQSFDSVRDFEERFAEPVRARQEAEGSAFPMPGEAAEEVSATRSADPITDREAAAVLDHILEESGTFENAADARASLAALKEGTNRQAVAGYRKLFAQLEKQHPDWTDEQLLSKLSEQLYENHSTAQDLESFVRRTMAQGGAEDRPLPPSKGEAPSPTSKELTMPIERRPPTDVRRENVPDFDYLVKRGPKKPAPPVPGLEGSQTPAAVRRLLKEEAQAIRDSVRGLMVNRATRDEILQANAHAAAQPHILGRQAETAVRMESATKGTFLRPGERGNPKILSAANAVVQAGFDRTQLANFQTMVNQGIAMAQTMAADPSWRVKRIGRAKLRNDLALRDELDYANNHWHDPELQATARKVESILNEQRAAEILAGFDVNKQPNYLPQRWDAQLWNGNSVILRALMPTNTRILGRRFTEPRSFRTYYHAAAEGPYLAVTRDAASLVGHRVRQGQTMLLRDAWHEAMKAVITPDGKPLAIDPVQSGKHMAWTSPDKNYKEIHLGHKTLVIHNDYATLVKQLVSESPLQDFAPTRAALEWSQRLKHTLLAGDFFHLGRMLYYGTAIMGTKARFKGGWSVLDMDAPTAQRAVQRGVITQAQADWANKPVNYGPGGQFSITRRELLHQAVRQGAELGTISDALYKDLVTKLTPSAGPAAKAWHRIADPSVGRYNRFLFDKLTRGLMAESIVHEFEKQAAKLPNLTNPEGLLRDIVKDVNNFYGNIGQQGLIKPRWAQDVGRLLFLAPQWVEGLVMKEVVGASRLTGLSKLTGQRQGLTALGTTGSAIGKGMVAMVALTQVLNLITRKQPTWMNEEEGHKLDAWIPAWGGRKEGFWLSPLAIYNELSHDLFRLWETKPKGIDAVNQIIGNKESPLVRAALVAITGKGPTGEYQTTSGGQLATAASQLAPVPITFGRYAQAAGHAVAPSIVPDTPPGAVQRQVFGTFGVKVEPAESAAAQISRIAKDFMHKEGLEKETGWVQVRTDEASYSKLRQALRANDENGARKNLQALLRSHTEPQLIKAMKTWARHGFTGSQKTERQFRMSLDDKQEALYSRALDGRYEDLEKFLDFMSRQP